MHTLLQHLDAAILSGMGATIGVLLWGKINSGLETKLTQEALFLVNVQDPDVKAVVVSVENLIAKKVPEASDARYAQFVDLVLADEPSLAPFRGLIIKILSSMGESLRKAAEMGSKA